MATGGLGSSGGVTIYKSEVYVYPQNITIYECPTGTHSIFWLKQLYVQAIGGYRTGVSIYLNCLNPTTGGYDSFTVGSPFIPSPTVNQTIIYNTAVGEYIPDVVTAIPVAFKNLNDNLIQAYNQNPLYARLTERTPSSTTPGSYYLVPFILYPGDRICIQQTAGQVADTFWLDCNIVEFAS